MDLFVCEKWVVRGAGMECGDAWEVGDGWTSIAEDRFVFLQNGVQRGWPWSDL